LIYRDASALTNHDDDDDDDDDDDVQIALELIIDQAFTLVA
jgi:hypothetical protein